MSPREQSGGFVPIADYAVMGDGRTSALLASDGRVDWWPVPTLDAPPIFSAILDPENGGYFSLSPEDAYEVARRYVEATNVLETTYTNTDGVVRVTSALNTGFSGRLPWIEFAFRVEAVDGHVAMGWKLKPGDRFGRASPSISAKDGIPIVTVGDQTVAVIVDGAEKGAAFPHTIQGRFIAEPDQPVLLALTATDREPLFIPSPPAIHSRLVRTEKDWARWSDQIIECGEWSPWVVRSALALKTLLTEGSGSIAAAATTSLPEHIGGPKNWDYRYSWVRDTSFTLDALLNLGLHEEVHGAVTWLLAAIRRNGPQLHVFYTLGGELPGNEDHLDAPGYRGSQPVRAGNGAASQFQLGNYGDLFDTLFRYVTEGHVLDHGTRQMLLNLADRCCDEWRSPDSGIWELPDTHHYTISKIGCWVALDRAVRLVEKGQLPSESVGRWKTERDEVRMFIDEHCWSQDKQAYSHYAGTDDLDAAVLLAARTGFDRGDRLVTTMDAITAELGHGVLLYRYTGAEDTEGAFVACTFWMIEALVYTRRIKRATTMMAEAVEMTNDVGLLAEQIDPITGEALGNFPQGLSHLSLINAAYTLVHAVG